MTVPFGWRVERAIRTCKLNASKLNVVWSLSEDEARTLVTSPCNLCAAAADLRNGGLVCMLDPALGYTSGNVVPVCRTCHRIRLLFSCEAELVAHSQRIVDNRQTS